MRGTTEAVVSVLVAIVGVATLAVLVSKNANTANVLTAGGKAFAGALSAATAPVTAGGTMPSFPVMSLGGGSPFNFQG